MPRTKVVKKNTQEGDSKESVIKFLLEHQQNKKKYSLDQLEKEKKDVLNAFHALLTEEKIMLSHKYVNLTIKEIIESEFLENTASVICISDAEVINITKCVRKDKKAVKRSASFVAGDEGYLTAESVVTNSRISRSKSKLNSTRTRSLSRTNLNNGTANYKTPANKKPSSPSYGVVTPKCKPNTPQILLRRPKNGEVALSMQGSPLYTASVVNENVANINIPLLDGTLLTLQPQRGLRVSQIPQFDPETLRQLQTLRENLTKVCVASEQRR